MKRKIKIYRMTLARLFPKTHPKAGEPTLFAEKIKESSKKHTIRANYQMWKRRIDEVNAGTAILVIFEWEDKPYRSEQKNLFVFCTSNPETLDLVFRYYYTYYNGLTLFIDRKIGVQKAIFVPSLQMVAAGNVEDGKVHSIDFATVALNDGLSLDNFRAWFCNYDLSKEIAIIHFTSYRY